MTQDERDRSRALFDAERKRVPELFDRAPMVDSRDYLHRIGIEEEGPEKPVGYIKLMSPDFIVEEVDQQGVCHTVDLDAAAALGGEGNTLFADLVKIGISTLEAQRQIAEGLHIEDKSFGFAGIKDRLALTSQRISIRGLEDVAALEALQGENFFLKNIQRGKGVVANGDLKGNRFTIVPRLPQPLTAAQKKEIEETVSIAAADGFWNFFSFQRFGTPRLISHLLGKKILQQDYEGTVRFFVTYQAPRELPYFAAMREQVEALWGDWNGIVALLDPFPYQFQHELVMVRHLARSSADFLGALHAIPEQVRLWIYAYDSYLFNRKLSELIKTGEVPLSLPLANSFNKADTLPYREYLEEDQVVLPTPAYRDFPFVRIASRSWSTLQNIEMHGFALEDRFAAFSFSLPKGAYATSFLMSLFTLASGLPIVPGIPLDPVDARALIGMGDMAPVLERFKPVLEQRQQDILNSET